MVHATPTHIANVGSTATLLAADEATSCCPVCVCVCLCMSCAGKGRGLVATEQLEPGQLLLVVPPLVLVEGGLGEIPGEEGGVVRIRVGVGAGLSLEQPRPCPVEKTATGLINSTNERLHGCLTTRI